MRRMRDVNQATYSGDVAYFRSRAIGASLFDGLRPWTCELPLG